MAAGGAAPLRGGEVTGVEAGASYGGSESPELGRGKRAPQRTQWRGRGHESTDREGRTE
jgi:hypothetical protein